MISKSLNRTREPLGKVIIGNLNPLPCYVNTAMSLMTEDERQDQLLE